MTASTLRLGKKPAVRPHGLKDLAVYATGPLPAPPAVSPVPQVAQWGMMDNDRLGCCTISGAGHVIVAANTEVGESDPIPSDPEIQSQYFAITGGADEGCVEADVLQLWHQSGLFGDNRIAGYAPVNPADLVGLHQAIAFYGSAYIGVALPQSAMDQFQAGQDWTVVPGSPIEGGHCIVLVGYNQQTVQAVTWGAVVNISYPWIARYMDEAWCVIPQAFAEAGRGPSLDLAALQADLARI